MKRIVYSLLLVSMLHSYAYADNISEVIVVGPSWDRFTNTDGTGLYHEILNEVFGLYGIRVIRQYVPSERAYDLVRSGRADMMTCHDVAVPPLQLAKYPMYAGAYHVFFSKHNVGEWKGVESMRDQSVVWRLGYYSPANFPVPIKPREVKTGQSAMGMVLLGRADFYVDDISFIHDSIQQNKISYDENEYDIKEAGYRTYHPVLLVSERGNAVKALYDKGMEQLIRSGKIQAIFEKWGFPLPPYSLEGSPN